MPYNLLLGNGINMHLRVEGMSESDIAHRFKKALITSSKFYELLFGVEFTDSVCDNIFEVCDKCGIESLAEKVHSYVIDNTAERLSLNLRMRLLDSIICTAMTAIFFDGKMKVGKLYNEENEVRT